MVAVVNFGSSNVTLFRREGDRLRFDGQVQTTSQPVSIDFGNGHMRRRPPHAGGRGARAGRRRRTDCPRWRRTRARTAGSDRTCAALGGPQPMSPAPRRRSTAPARLHEPGHSGGLPPSAASAARRRRPRHHAGRGPSGSRRASRLVVSHPDPTLTSGTSSRAAARLHDSGRNRRHARDEIDSRASTSDMSSGEGNRGDIA